MAKIRSTQGTVIFNNESLEYGFVTVVKHQPQLQAVIRDWVLADWPDGVDRNAWVGRHLRRYVRDGVVPHLPEKGWQVRLFTGYLDALDWYDLAMYYIEAYREETGDGEA